MERVKDPFWDYSELVEQRADQNRALYTEARRIRSFLKRVEPRLATNIFLDPSASARFYPRPRGIREIISRPGVTLGYAFLNEAPPVRVIYNPGRRITNDEDPRLLYPQFFPDHENLEAAINNRNFSNLNLYQIWNGGVRVYPFAQFESEISQRIVMGRMGRFSNTSSASEMHSALLGLEQQGRMLGDLRR